VGVEWGGRFLGWIELADELRPSSAVAVARLSAMEGRKVGVAGDGVNDAPALAAADVSFALASGSGASLDVADITLMKNGSCGHRRRDRTVARDALQEPAESLFRIRLQRPRHPARRARDADPGHRWRRDGAELGVGRHQLAAAQPMATAQIKIHGMTCEGCVKSVSRTLAAVPGAKVSYDAARTSVADLKKAVARAGYEAP
jgi:cation transport ATPase